MVKRIIRPDWYYALADLDLIYKPLGARIVLNALSC